MKADSLPSHFKGKDALEHVAEVQAKGIVSSIEMHGTDIPGHLSAAADCARDFALLIPLLWALLHALHLSQDQILWMAATFSLGWLFWRCGRSAWLGWFRLERLHRALEQERWEIEHHRQQERDELKVMYSAKGLEGKLLEDVIDVLMADDTRLLRIMVEEELGLSLESQEHPLKQGVGALIGGLFAISLCLLFYLGYALAGLLIGSALVMTLASILSSFHASNRWIPAILWNIGIGGVAFLMVYSLLEYISRP